LPFLDVGAVLQRLNFQIVIAAPQWKRSPALLTQKGSRPAAILAPSELI
jgi:hypothetical protein